MALTVLKTGLIGQNISRTRLGAGLQLMCDAAGIGLEFELIDTANHPDFDLPDCLAQLRDRGWHGVSVTHPWKPDAARWADGPAARIGASNLITFGNPDCAWNTDCSGFLSSWRARFGPMVPGRVVMVGAGGVALAISHALKELGVETLWIADLDATKSAALAQACGPVAQPIEIAQLPDVMALADGLINTTNMGMAGYGGSAFPQPLSGSANWAFDAVYTPVDTPFLRQAASRDMQVMTGFDLFRHMAVAQFQTLTGAKAPPDVLEQLSALRPREVAA